LAPTRFAPSVEPSPGGRLRLAAYARFTQAEGASYHCQPLARELTEQRMFDWMDEQIQRPHQ
jgi:hypothetical protein